MKKETIRVTIDFEIEERNGTKGEALAIIEQTLSDTIPFLFVAGDIDVSARSFEIKSCRFVSRTKKREDKP
jgi:hypothetical protein